MNFTYKDYLSDDDMKYRPLWADFIGIRNDGSWYWVDSLDIPIGALDTYKPLPAKEAYMNNEEQKSSYWFISTCIQSLKVERGNYAARFANGKIVNDLPTPLKIGKQYKVLSAFSRLDPNSIELVRTEEAGV